ncbi:MAG: hypothetical protein WAT93_10065 [Pontixanthobacter sp.]
MRKFAAIAAITALTCTTLNIAAYAETLPTNALEQAKLVNDSYSRYYTQAKDCRWGAATIDAAMYRERMTWIDIAALDDKSAADAIKNASTEAGPCNGPADKQARSESGLIYWRWLTRSALMAQLVGSPGWGQNLLRIDSTTVTMVEPVRASVEKSLTDAYGAAFVQNEISNLKNEAIFVLNLICEPRKNERSTTPRQCPNLPADAAAKRPIALIRAQNIELFNSGLQDDIRTEGRGEYGMPYQYRLKLNFFGNSSADFGSSKCDPSVYTIYPAASDTIVTGDVYDMSIHRIGVQGIFGRAKFRRDEYQDYTLVGEFKTSDSTLVLTEAMEPTFSFCTNF